jgi:hypothetical protein
LSYKCIFSFYVYHVTYGFVGLLVWACGRPECFCWGGRLLHSGRPSRSLVVGVSVTSVVLVPGMQGVLCAVVWCLFPVLLSTYDERNDEFCRGNPKFYITLNEVSVGAVPPSRHCVRKNYVERRSILYPPPPIHQFQ